MFLRVFCVMVPALVLTLAGCEVGKSDNKAPAGKAAPTSAPKAEPKAEPKPVAKTEPKAEPKAEPKVEPKAEPKPVAKPEPKDDKDVVAVVDGEKITRQELEETIKMASRGQPGAPPEREVLDMLISQKLLKKFIATQKIEIDPEMLFSIKLNTYIQNMGPTEAQAQAQALDKAKAVKKQLDGGKDFAELARQESICPSGKRSGGDLGEFLPERMDPAFTRAVQALKINGTSEPIKTQFGYHVIQRLPLKDAADPEKDKLHARHILIPIDNPKEEETMRRNFKKLIEDLRAKAKIENRLPPAPPSPAGKLAPGAPADPFGDD